MKWVSKQKRLHRLYMSTEMRYSVKCVCPFRVLWVQHKDKQYLRGTYGT